MELQQKKRLLYYVKHMNHPRYNLSNTSSGYEIECKNRGIRPHTEFTDIDLSDKIYDKLAPPMSYTYKLGGDYFKSTSNEVNTLLALETAEELYKRRSMIFKTEKKEYGLTNKDLYGLTGVFSKRWDEFGSQTDDFNKNVFFAFCFFFEYTYDQSKRLMYYSRHSFDNSFIDKLFLMYIDHNAFALATFVDDVNQIFSLRRTQGKYDKIPKFYDLNPDARNRKVYFDTSLSDCLIDGKFKFDEVIQENKTQMDRRRKELNQSWDDLI